MTGTSSSTDSEGIPVLGDAPKSKKDSKDKAEKDWSVRVLQQIYDEKGPNSPEFYEQVKRFLIFLQHKYMNHYDEDCLHDCYARLLESFEYWDSSKSNIVSWVHMVCRNRISSFCHTTKKRQKENGVLNEQMEGSFSLGNVESRDRINAYVSSFSTMLFIPENEEVLKCLSILEEHPLFQASLWEETACLRQKSNPCVMNMRWT